MSCCVSCCCYHKGTYFQANHNRPPNSMHSVTVVVATTKVHIFKQITTIADRKQSDTKLLLLPQRYIFSSKSQLPVSRNVSSYRCCCYHKGTYFQANHNRYKTLHLPGTVVVATTKVHIFKQITTKIIINAHNMSLLLLPQRYIFSSKSQLKEQSQKLSPGCCCYHKGTYFQANHNYIM